MNLPVPPPRIAKPKSAAAWSEGVDEDLTETGEAMSPPTPRNHPKLSRIHGWLTFLLVLALILFVGFAITVSSGVEAIENLQ